jgi:hypothetical protein
MVKVKKAYSPTRTVVVNIQNDRLYFIPTSLFSRIPGNSCSFSQFFHPLAAGTIIRQ